MKTSHLVLIAVGIAVISFLIGRASKKTTLTATTKTTTTVPTATVPVTPAATPVATA